MWPGMEKAYPSCCLNGLNYPLDSRRTLNEKQLQTLKVYNTMNTNRILDDFKFFFFIQMLRGKSPLKLQFCLLHNQNMHRNNSASGSLLAT